MSEQFLSELVKIFFSLSLFVNTYSFGNEVEGESLDVAIDFNGDVVSDIQRMLHIVLQMGFFFQSVDMRGFPVGFDLVFDMCSGGVVESHLVCFSVAIDSRLVEIDTIWRDTSVVTKQSVKLEGMVELINIRHTSFEHSHRSTRQVDDGVRQNILLLCHSEDDIRIPIFSFRKGGIN